MGLEPGTSRSSARYTLTSAPSCHLKLFSEFTCTSAFSHDSTMLFQKLLIIFKGYITSSGPFAVLLLVHFHASGTLYSFFSSSCNVCFACITQDCILNPLTIASMDQNQLIKHSLNLSLPARFVLRWSGVARLISFAVFLSICRQLVTGLIRRTFY